MRTSGKSTSIGARKRMTGHICLLSVMTFGAAAVAVAAGTPRPRDLGTLGGDFSAAQDINEKDQIVGASFTAGDQLHAFVWKDGVMKDIGTLGGSTSRALAINEKGHVVGGSTPRADNFDEVAFVWPGKGKLIRLGALPGDRASQANDINDDGTIVGQSGATPRAVIWRDRKIEALPAPASELSIANAVNNHCQVVGVAVIENVGARAVLWQNGAMKVLGTLAGTPGATSVATDINDRGQIVGRSTSRSGLEHGFLYENGVFHDLGPLSEGGLSGAAGLSENGLIVGDATNAADVRTAVLWRNRRIQDLGTLNPFGTSQASAVNKAGHVVGSATAGGEDADIHAVLWR
jgi:probable HAF family extracellular repeat protein